MGGEIWFHSRLQGKDMTERLAPPSALTPEQADAARTFEASRGRPPFGPFATLLHSPELMAKAEAMGEYLRYRSGLPSQLSELAILIVSRAWSQPVEWAIHHPIAIAAGVSPETVDAVAHRRRPDAMPADEGVLHDFCVELVETRGVSDQTYASALGAFGEQGVIDLAGLCGYYAFLAAVMNVARTAAPDGPALPA